MSYIFTGDNPSQLYMDALKTILEEGDNVAPRGKKILEIRPVIFEFTNPMHRVTFLKGRVINPFFQLAESLWILLGRSDVAWLEPFNKSIGQFSDDSNYFNAPYGERLRRWNSNDLHNFVFNPMDQLHDVFRKLKADKDSRQAVALIYNPIFDHSRVETLDRPCNLVLTFKIRDNKLDLTVFNRSNDLHWGLFGANLVQFSTILELMAVCLEVEVGCYYHITDSLHVYLDDYGAAETDKISSSYGGVARKNRKYVSEFYFQNEPKMTSQFEFNLNRLADGLEEMVVRDTVLEANPSRMFSMLDSLVDPYAKLSVSAMLAYRTFKLGMLHECVEALRRMPDCSWKISCLRFLQPALVTSEVSEDFINLYKGLPAEHQGYINRLDILKGDK